MVYKTICPKKFIYGVLKVAFYNSNTYIGYIPVPIGLYLL